LWQHDPSVWSVGSDPAVAAIIKNRLGWLTVAERMGGSLDELIKFADDVRHENFSHVVLLGMGGSSLCPIVLRQTFGKRKGFPELHVLDSTVPEAIARLEKSIDLPHTLFIEASKSGTTLESRSFGEYFFTKAVAAAGGDAARAAVQFVYITDPGTPLAQLGEQRGVRHVFLNPPDIGGRYSALSYFGIVPAALAGYDVAGLLRRAQLMLAACAAGVKAVEHPAVSLGVALAQSALRHGRDKVTLLTSPRIASLGLWLEQLIAESTGKLGKGLIPVADEPLGDPGAYGADRVFVFLQLSGDESFNGRREALEKAGHPVVQITLRDELDLGEEFFCWEFATATIGALLDIDPFDEPNVKESKDNTDRILAARTDGDAPAALSPSDGKGIASAFAAVKQGDYIALAAFIAETPQRTEMLQHLRAMLRDASKAATTLGYGPRFLHSTGQLHKGGPNTGFFVQLIGGDTLTLPIPDQPFDFATLKDAQALGDLQSLQAHGRRVIRIDLGADIDAGLASLRRTLTDLATRLTATAGTKG
ncbi:MAG: hypothetical protein M3Z37_08780, partial [Candidatus Eremiobacteraeota bacterium]|nr:hypothetical protein [Candidatus Eremiobacteraeota bacterium]